MKYEYKSMSIMIYIYVFKNVIQNRRKTLPRDETLTSAKKKKQIDYYNIFLTSCAVINDKFPTI